MVAIPWKFESSYPHHGFGVVAQLIERYVRIVEVVGLSPISSTTIYTVPRRCGILKSLRGYGGMVDAEDLKSFGHCDRVGSSPTIPTKISYQTNKKNDLMSFFLFHYILLTIFKRHLLGQFLRSLGELIAFLYKSHFFQHINGNIVRFNLMFCVHFHLFLQFSNTI